MKRDPADAIPRDDDLFEMPRPVVAEAHDYETGHATGRHSHPCGQLLYAAEGVMRVTTPESVWLIPSMRGLWLPPATHHEVAMLGRVTMRTIYVERAAAARFGPRCRSLEITRLLRELILSLAEEPVAYAPGSRGEHLAALVLSEIEAAPSVPIEIPWPRDRRLVAVCEAIMREPGRTHTIGDWADLAGASARTLIRLFPRETGLHYRQWLRQVHVADAVCRLSRGDSVGSTAAALGYASPSAFSAMFRRMLGVPPQRYI